MPTASGGILRPANIAPAMLSSGLPAMGVALWIETIEKRLNICHRHIVTIGKEQIINDIARSPIGCRHCLGWAGEDSCSK